ncbi:hypothetical protein, partial [Methyloceanibacter sp.]|uniref:hypothetical protein n=1 Tax=Methyloceanibacter sp. TaxID=1965321 RepID=UPI003C77A071
MDFGLQQSTGHIVEYFGVGRHHRFGAELQPDLLLAHLLISRPDPGSGNETDSIRPNRRKIHVCNSAKGRAFHLERGLSAI